MKIAESNMMYHSTSSYERIHSETTYTLDENELALRKDGIKTTESRTTTAAAYYNHTNPNGGTRSRRVARTLTPEEIITNKQADIEDEDDFGKNFYVSSILDWAADTIDSLVSAFEQEMSPQETQSKIPTAPESLEPIPSDEIMKGNAFTKSRIKVYREMASMLRNKAFAMLPEEARIAPPGSRLRKTLTQEEENLGVQAQGTIQTKDGRSIDFYLDIKIHRENITKTTQTVLIDPLVINFEGNFAELTDEKISFDLNSDGKSEQISTLKEGSGFLALDLNKDGKINNGMELFGPSTGDGFNELSFYDSDNNNWIDENDPIYNELLVWIKDDSQDNILKKLADTGVGAIHLGSVDSEFTIKGKEDQTLGEVARTGIAFMENGETKTIQQINLLI